MVDRETHEHIQESKYSMRAEPKNENVRMSFGKLRPMRADLVNEKVSTPLRASRDEAKRRRMVKGV